MPVMPSPARKQKIVREFFQKRAIELQTAVIVLVPVATRNQEPCNSISIQYSTLLDWNTYDHLFTASFLHCTLYAHKSLTRMWRCIAFRPYMFRDGGGR